MFTDDTKEEADLGIPDTRASIRGAENGGNL